MRIQGHTLTVDISREQWEALKHRLAPDVPLLLDAGEVRVQGVLLGWNYWDGQLRLEVRDKPSFAPMGLVMRRLRKRVEKEIQV
jgi:hypothetical protein